MRKLFSKIETILRLVFKGTFGAWASAMFLICLLSGILLAVHYDSDDAYQSISNILLFNPWASLFRNLHFWSAQLFLVLSIIHFWGYLRKKFFKQMRPGVWLRLILGFILLFIAMFTGFLLKGDADSIHAATILSSLLSSLPFLGETLTWSVLGDGESLLLPYVHHIATATIFLVIIIKEHSRKLWTGTQIFIISLIAVSLLSFFLTAPLHDGQDQVVKGPWYFLGVQELLHWLPNPAYSWIFLVIFVLLVYLLRHSNEKISKVIRTTLLIFGISFLLFTAIGLFLRSAHWDWSVPGNGDNAKRYPVLGPVFISHDYLTVDDSIAKIESCLICHDGFSGFSPGHDPNVIGCSSCHGGHPFSMSASVAHRNMRLIPGNLSDASSSCSSSSCHPDILPRINNSLMTSMSGIIAIDEWIFGESNDPDILRHVNDVGHSAAGTHLRNLCLSCHLGNEKTELGPPDEDSRGGGCLACHVSYSDIALEDLNQYRNSSNQDSLRNMNHPRIGLEISNDHCFGCHSRSGRISTNYEGWHETLTPLDSVKGQSSYRIIQNARVFTKMPEDVHHKAGMLCVDCHNSWEVMGDGQQYAHEEDAVGVTCQDCHSSGTHTSSTSLDYEARKILVMRALDPTRAFIRTGKTERALLGAWIDSSGQAIFKSHVNGSRLLLSPPADICSRGEAHGRLDCNACHAGWAPRCIGCHTAYDKNIAGQDLYLGEATQGKWFELSGGFLAGLPGLGITERNGETLIRPVIPGMIMTLDQSEFPNSGKGEQFFRLFAPSSPHTTQATGRSCESCHLDPIAIGYGEGRIEFDENTGVISFDPTYENLHQDGLPADAWIGFLAEPASKMSATRKNLRPFSIEEQKSILTVGVCLTCHESDSDIMLRSLDNFDAQLQNLSPSCRVPSFK